MTNEQVLHEIYVGSAIGSFKKYISYINQTTVLNNIADLQKGDEITQLKWFNAEQSKILLGQKNGCVKVFDISKEQWKTRSKIVIENTLVGLGVINNKIVTAENNGNVTIWKKNAQITLNASPNLEVLTTSSNSSKFATGGKENCLKLWDAATKTVVFTAKNIPHDMLELRVPIWVSGIEILNEFELATVSRYSNVCFYDTRAQRRPITRLEYEDAAYSCVTSTYRERTVAVGGGKGLLQQIDLRKPSKVLHKYKGCVGGVADLKCDPDLPYLFSVSLDRRLRIHNLNNTHLIDEVYMKSRLNRLLVKRHEIKKEEVVEDDEKEKQVANKKKKKKRREIDASGDYLFENDNIYDSEEEIEHKRTKRK